MVGAFFGKCLTYMASSLFLFLALSAHAQMFLTEKGEKDKDRLQKLNFYCKPTNQYAFKLKGSPDDPDCRNNFAFVTLGYLHDEKTMKSLTESSMPFISEGSNVDIIRDVNSLRISFKCPSNAKPNATPHSDGSVIVTLILPRECELVGDTPPLQNNKPPIGNRTF